MSNPAVTYDQIKKDLAATPRSWLVTGAAGFIGSNLVEQLLFMDQNVIGLDNLSTGRQGNLDSVKKLVGEERWEKFRFVQDDIRNIEICKQLTSGCDYVLHQAALGSVVRSVIDPLSTHQANVDGFLNVLISARDAGVKSFVYASSSSVYGDSKELPKKEYAIGTPLSPYAASKRINEVYAGVFSGLYSINTIGLRYFNVFGPRQDAQGEYAAVIPRWIQSLSEGQPCTIFGDGTTSRDFCFISNVVEANIRAAVLTYDTDNSERIFNIGAGKATTLKELFQIILDKVARIYNVPVDVKPAMAPERLGDIKHSLADTSAAKRVLGYEASVGIAEGLERMISAMYSEKG